MMHEIFRRRDKDSFDIEWFAAYCEIDEPSPAVPQAPEPKEQPTLSLLYRRRELMPDGSIGAVFIGEFAGDRSKDLRLTVAQAQNLAFQITQAVGNHTIHEKGASHAGK